MSIIVEHTIRGNSNNYYIPPNAVSDAPRVNFIPVYSSDSHAFIKLIVVKW